MTIAVRVTARGIHPRIAISCHVAFRPLENQRKVMKERQARLVSVAIVKARVFQEPIRLDME
jgi:hypothetical protein